jgi:hypothetical protein
MASVVGVIPIQSSIGPLFIGRYTDPATGQVYLGKAFATLFSSSFNYWDSVNGLEVTLIDGFEVLTCAP